MHVGGIVVREVYLAQTVCIFANYAKVLSWSSTISIAQFASSCCVASIAGTDMFAFPRWYVFLLSVLVQALQNAPATSLYTIHGCSSSHLFQKERLHLPIKVERNSYVSDGVRWCLKSAYFSPAGSKQTKRPLRLLREQNKRAPKDEHDESDAMDDRAPQDQLGWCQLPLPHRSYWIY